MRTKHAYRGFLSPLNVEQLLESITLLDILGPAVVEEATSTVAAEEPAPPASTFKPGDVVYLASGGPAMTIERIADVGVDVTWWAGDEQGYEECTFQPAALVRNNPLE